MTENIVKSTCISCQKTFYMTEAVEAMVRAGREASLCLVCNPEERDENSGD